MLTRSKIFPYVNTASLGTSGKLRYEKEKQGSGEVCWANTAANYLCLVAHCFPKRKLVWWYNTRKGTKDVSYLYSNLPAGGSKPTWHLPLHRSWVQDVLLCPALGARCPKASPGMSAALQHTQRELAAPTQPSQCSAMHPMQPRGRNTLSVTITMNGQFTQLPFIWRGNGCKLALSSQTLPYWPQHPLFPHWHRGRFDYIQKSLSMLGTSYRTTQRPSVPRDLCPSPFNLIATQWQEKHINLVLMPLLNSLSNEHWFMCRGLLNSCVCPDSIIRLSYRHLLLSDTASSHTSSMNDHRTQLQRRHSGSRRARALTYIFVCISSSGSLWSAAVPSLGFRGAFWLTTASPFSALVSHLCSDWGQSWFCLRA